MFFSIRSIRSVLAASAISAGLCIASPALANSGSVGMRAISPGAAVSLNPQPIPPGFGNPGGPVSLNPQPIPPGRGGPLSLGF
jgi:hypothetical protein